MSDSQCINGGDIVWVANHCITEIADPLKFRNQFLFQILKKINTCLADKVLTYKLLDSENTIKQTLENTDIIGFLLQNHLFPVSIDRTTLIVDQLSDDNESFKTTKSQQTIKSWFSNYFKINRGKLTPEVENYIKSFKPEILTAEIAESTNFELFAPGKTIEQQIELLFTQAEKFIKDGKITFSLYVAKNDPIKKICDRSLEAILVSLNENVIIYFEVYRGIQFSIFCP